MGHNNQLITTNQLNFSMVPKEYEKEFVEIALEYYWGQIHLITHYYDENDLQLPTIEGIFSGTDFNDVCAELVSFNQFGELDYYKNVPDDEYEDYLELYSEGFTDMIFDIEKIYDYYRLSYLTDDNIMENPPMIEVW